MFDYGKETEKKMFPGKSAGESMITWNRLKSNICGGQSICEAENGPGVVAQ